ncbi:MAG: porphobilinogen synthase [Planctomycetes bacterium]|nr:porphobilinogen synthase [Planctomycetota bacterium]
MGFPEVRMRRLRRNETLRRMVRRYHLSVDDLVMPLFVRPGEGVRRPIESMPGNFQLSTDELVKECREIERLGIPAVILFGIPEKKDSMGSQAVLETGIVQTAIRAVKEATDDLVVISDVCLCEYTDHGHCGILNDAGEVDNDQTLEVLAAEALSHARAGADIVAPSDMMDGRVGFIRGALDEAGFKDVVIMAYSAKFASAFYGPFRDAAESTPQSGDRRGYQMDFNAEEALREVELDIAEGADIVMVKPALAYLDIVRQARERFDVPLAVYNVSGEFAMVKAAAEKGWLDEGAVVMEMLYAAKRAGADIILTYWAMDVARRLG